MVVIYTGSNEIDKILEAEIKGSMVVSYEDFIIEDDKFKDQTVILGANSIERNLKEYLFLLRNKNIRVILLLDKDRNEKTKIALEYGIYDLVFGNFYPSQIIEILNNPKQFSDISKIYKKCFDIHIKKNRRKGYKYEKK
ncbi:MAG: hypothetical protein ACLSW4_02680 [Clostridia bacterium]|nr:hypothetical protein [Clostridiaceae bacterium]